MRAIIKDPMDVSANEAPARVANPPKIRLGKIAQEVVWDVK